MNTFRKTYRELTALEQERVEQIKDKAQELEQILDARRLGCTDVETLRQLALARTNLEQAVMWAVKAHT